MGKFDLNNAADFARATDSFGASVLQNFTGGNTDWLIEEASYKSGINPNNVARFHIFRTATDYDGALSSISDSGGRRLAKFQFPYQDGQVTEDMGRMAEKFSLDIVIHGNNYLAAFNNILKILNEPVPGTLVHPVRGEIVCKMESYELIHQASERKSVTIKLQMEEHSFDPIALFNPKTKKTAPSLLSNLSQSFVKIENAINAVQGAFHFVTSLRNQIIANIKAYQQSFSQITGNMNSTFNAGNTVPGISPTTSGGVLNSSGQIVANSVSIAASPDDPLQSTPSAVLNSTTQQALNVDKIFKDINNLRAQLATTIAQMENAGGGVGALTFFDNIMDLRATANDLQDAFEAGKQSSQAILTQYTTPRLMSIREIAFANGLTPDDGIQIILLNPQIDSANFVPKGTVLNVAVT